MSERLTLAILKYTIRCMKICRYINSENQVHIGLAKDENTLFDLTSAEVESITSIMENEAPKNFLSDLKEKDLPEVPLNLSLIHI